MKKTRNKPLASLHRFPSPSLRGSQSHSKQWPFEGQTMPNHMGDLPCARLDSEVYLEVFRAWQDVTNMHSCTAGRK